MKLGVERQFVRLRNKKGSGQQSLLWLYTTTLELISPATDDARSARVVVLYGSGPIRFRANSLRLRRGFGGQVRRARTPRPRPRPAAALPSSSISRGFLKIEWAAGDEHVDNSGDEKRAGRLDAGH